MCNILFLGIIIILILLIVYFLLFRKPQEEKLESFYQSQNSYIPKVIYQTFPSNKISGYIRESIDSWKKMNPHYKYVLFNDETMRNYMVKKSSPRILAAYDKLIPMAYKADLFRYVLMWNEGGIYADVPIVSYYPLDNIIEDKMTLVKDLKNHGVWNAILAMPPKHDLMYLATWGCVENIEKNNYGKTPLDITGPKFLERVVFKYYGTKNLSEIPNCTVLFNTTKNFIGGKVKKGDKIVMEKQYMKDAIRRAKNRKNYYDTLWHEKNVYNY